MTRIVVFGHTFADWLDALTSRETWRAVPGVTDLRHVVDPAEIASLPPTPADTVILPLGEDHIRNCPPGFRSLIPDRQTLDILADKARFAAFMDEAGFAALCPRLYRTVEEAQFPLVLKRLDMTHSEGVAPVRSRQQLDTFLAMAPFAGHPYLLQAMVPGDTEYVLHCVCRGGEILWSETLARSLGTGMTASIKPRPGPMAQIATVLARLGYSGPGCVDYKLFKNGDAALLEINPRFGGSLMKPVNRPALQQALACLVANAR